MFKRKYRASVLKKPYRVIPTQFLTIRIGQNNLLFSRFSVVVSKKVDKRATHRNKIKRTIRICLKDLSVGIQAGYDMIVVVKKEMITQTSEAVCSVLKTSLTKEGLII